MENFKEEKVSRKKKPGLLRRLAALAAAAALALSLAACDGSVPSVPGGSADVVPNPAASAASSFGPPPFVTTLLSIRSRKNASNTIFRS